MPFFNKTKNFLGIDVGTFSIKVVELSYSKKGKVVLENYGEVANDPKVEDIFHDPRKKSFSLSHQLIADNIKKVLSEAGIKKREAVFSIPDFMTFFTVFKTPPMPQEEIGTTIQFEARQHIPLPLKDVTLDWSIIEKNDGNVGPKILLVAVPNKVIEEYQKIAQLAGVSLLSIEAEVFSLARTIFAKEELNKIIQLVDVGVQSTTISIVHNSMVKATHSVDFSEMDLIKELAVKMNLSYNEANEIKRTSGFNENSEQGKVLCKKLDSLINEINQIADNLFRTDKKEVNKIIVSGGTSLSPGLKDYIQLKTKKETQIINPFVDFSYPPALKEILEEIGPRYAIATGLALRDR
jgi:type IV pilus assembly protein PilM